MQTTIDIPTKTAASSLTIWLNVLTIALVIVGALLDNALSLGIPPAVLAYIAVANGVLNTLLRLYRTALPIGPEGGVKSVSIELPRTAG